MELDGELKSKLDFSKLDDATVAFLMQLEVLLLDEVFPRVFMKPKFKHWFSVP